MIYKIAGLNRYMLFLIPRPQSLFLSTMENQKTLNCSKPKIFITRPDLPASALHLLKDYDLDVWDQPMAVPQAEFHRRICGKNALYIYSGDRIDAEALDAAGESLKVISTMSVGYDHIDVEEVKRRGIKLGYTPEVLNDAVAELAIGLLLTLSRKLSEARALMVGGQWKSWSKWDWMNGFGLKNAVVGIFGMGRIGTEIARRLMPFKPSKILYAARTVKQEAEELKAEFVSLERLLEESDAVFVSVSLSPDTQGILNEEKLGLMKKTAIIVNISRGGVIDQKALVKLLKEKKIGGAALDVMTPEPLPPNHELLTLDNCFTTPHIGSAEISTRLEMAELTSKNIIAGLEGTRLPMEL